MQTSVEVLNRDCVDDNISHYNTKIYNIAVPLLFKGDLAKIYSYTLSSDDIVGGPGCQLWPQLNLWKISDYLSSVLDFFLLNIKSWGEDYEAYSSTVANLKG